MGGKRNGAITGGFTPELAGIVAAALGEDLKSPPVPLHVAPMLKTRLSARPVRRAVSLSPCPDPRAARRVEASGVLLRDLRVRGAAGEPRVARATDRLLDSFAAHMSEDLRLPGGRVEAMVRALGFLLWFQRRYAGGSPLRLSADVVRACFGNYYIRRHTAELSWIHYGLRGCAAFAAFLHRIQWADTLDVSELTSLPEDARWFRDRLETYWMVEGEALHEWVAEHDFAELIGA